MAALFPIFLKLQGRKCLVVGAGKIAEQKLGSLIEAGAAVTVVAPEASEAIRQRVNAGEVRWHQREFAANDIDGAVLLIAATGNPDVNERVFQEAEARGILCNAVDEPKRCHFYYPSVVRRGDLQIAISTNGKSPALAQRLRAELEARFDTAYADWVEWLGTVREMYFRSRMKREERVTALHRIAAAPVYERFKSARSRRAEVSSREVLHG